MSDWIRENLQGRDERRRVLAQRIFPTPPEPDEASRKPQGDADAGKGTAGDPEYEHTPHGYMRVFTEAELIPDNEGN